MPFCFIASSHVPRPKAKLTKKNVQHLREFSSAIFFLPGEPPCGSLPSSSSWLPETNDAKASELFMLFCDCWICCLFACLCLRLEPKQKIETKKNWFSFQFQSVTGYAFSKCLRIFCFNQLFFLTSCAVLPEEFFWAGLAPCSRSPPTSNLSEMLRVERCFQAPLRGHMFSSCGRDI